MSKSNSCISLTSQNDATQRQSIENSMEGSLLHTFNNISSTDLDLGVSDCSITNEHIIKIDQKKLNKLLTKLQMAKMNITPLVDEILHAASSFTASEFKERIRNNGPICSVSSILYIKAFKAADILREVNNELVVCNQNSNSYAGFPLQEIIVNNSINHILQNYSLTTFNVEKIYIDRDTMKQLIELHELVGETIKKLQSAEHTNATSDANPNETLPNQYVSQPEDIIKSDNSIATGAPSKKGKTGKEPLKGKVPKEKKPPKEKVKKVPSKGKVPKRNASKSKIDKNKKTKIVDDKNTPKVDGSESLYSPCNINSEDPTDITNLIGGNICSTSRVNMQLRKYEEPKYEEPKYNKSSEVILENNNPIGPPTPVVVPAAVPVPVPDPVLLPQKQKKKQRSGTVLQYADTVATDHPPSINDVEQAKQALLNCLGDLSHIREFLQGINSPEIQLEREIQLEMEDHNVSCHPYDEPHIHCNIFGIPLTIKTNKDVYPTRDTPFPAPIASSSVKTVEACTNTEDSKNITLDIDVKEILSNAKKMNIDSVQINKKQLPKGTICKCKANTKIPTQSQHTNTIQLPPIEPIELTPVPAKVTTNALTNIEEHSEDTITLTDDDELNTTVIEIKENTESIVEMLKTPVNSTVVVHRPIATDSDVGLPYVVDLKSLPNINGNDNICNSMVIDIESMKRMLNYERLFHPIEIINQNITEIGADNLLLASTPVKCSTRTVINDKRDMPGVPLKASLNSLPLSRTDISVIKENVERKRKDTTTPSTHNIQYTKTCKPFEYYTNFQDNFTSNLRYFVPPIYQVYYFEFLLKNDEDQSQQIQPTLPENTRQPITQHQSHHRRKHASTATQSTGTTTTLIPTENYNNVENSSTTPPLSEFRFFDFLRKSISMSQDNQIIEHTQIELQSRRGKTKRMKNKKCQINLDKLKTVTQMNKSISLDTYNPSSRSLPYEEKYQKRSSSCSSCTKNNDSKTEISCRYPDKSTRSRSSSYYHSEQNIPAKIKAVEALSNQTSTTTSTNSLQNYLLDTIYEYEEQKKSTGQQRAKKQQADEKKFKQQNITGTMRKFTTNILNINNNNSSSIIDGTGSCKSASRQQSRMCLNEPECNSRNRELSPVAEGGSEVERRNRYRSLIPRRSEKLVIDNKSSDSDSCLSEDRRRSRSSSKRIPIAPKPPNQHEVRPVKKLAKVKNQPKSSCSPPRVITCMDVTTSIAKSPFNEKATTTTNHKANYNKIQHDPKRKVITKLSMYNCESVSSGTSEPSRKDSKTKTDVDGPENCTTPLLEELGNTKSEIHNFPGKHSAGYLSVLSPSCGCPDVTVFIPCMCCGGAADKCDGRGGEVEVVGRGGRRRKRDIMKHGISGMYHVILPPSSINAFKQYPCNK